MTRQDIINETEQIINYLFSLADSKEGFKNKEKAETEQKIKHLKDNGFKELVKEPAPKTITTPATPATGSRPIY